MTTENATLDALEDERDRTHQETGERLLRYFTFDHLSGPLARVSSVYTRAAIDTVRVMPAGPERSVALRKLLEAKDAAVRGTLIP